MRAFALAIAVILTGVALATPVDVLRVDPGGVLVAVPDGGRYEYSYQQSIYLVPVREEHERNGDSLRIVRVRSSDLRAVEYFRWDGEIRREGDEFVQDAPANHVRGLAIRVTTLGAQHLRAGGRDLSLRDRFGEVVVTVTATRTAWVLVTFGRSPW